MDERSDISIIGSGPAGLSAAQKIRGENMSIYDMKLCDIDSNCATMESFKGKVLLVVNTASKCGFTPQYEDLQKLYDRYQGMGFEILGFPSNQFKEQEPANSSEIKNFCLINYGVSFPLFEKTDVRGKDAHPLFKYLTAKAPFEGYDNNNSMGKIIRMITENEYPLFLHDDSIKWNFTKFLIDRNGQVIKRFEPTVAPLDIEPAIKELL
jgi:glutathione peroxidase